MQVFAYFILDREIDRGLAYGLTGPNPLSAVVDSSGMIEDGAAKETNFAITSTVGISPFTSWTSTDIVPVPP